MMLTTSADPSSISPVPLSALFQCQQIREIEIAAKKVLPVGALMRAAGLAASRLALQLLSKSHGRILVLAGAGDNGGDALEVAYLLSQEGLEVNLLWYGVKEKHSDEAQQSLARAQQSTATWLNQQQVVEMPLSHWDLIIDGLFGIGLDRAIEGPIANLVSHLNQETLRHAVPVLALDIPSGLLADTGHSLGGQQGVLRADHTVSFIADKVGLHTAMGKDVAGVVHVAHLGLNPSEFPVCKTHLLSANSFRNQYPKRLQDSHKGTYGDVFIIGGSDGMAGAPILAGRAALFCGTGRVHLGFVGNAPMFDPQHPELMCKKVQNANYADAVIVIGPGLGTTAEARELLQNALQESQSMVIDADALNILAGDEELQALLHLRHQQYRKTILTPHPLEAARLLKTTAQAIQADRRRAVQELARSMHACVVLKGAGSMIAYEGQVWVNSTGNPSLATAGTGDVLAGVCGALLAQGLATEHAACLAVYLHGKAADDLLAAGAGPIGLAASEFIPAIRQALNQI